MLKPFPSMDCDDVDARLPVGLAGTIIFCGGIPGKSPKLVCNETHLLMLMTVACNHGRLWLDIACLLSPAVGVYFLVQYHWKKRGSSLSYFLIRR
jgi:hypothetical protein